MIKLVVFDIDGVVTDGMVQIDAAGKERKSMNLKDVDAIFEIKRQGFQIGAITGEESTIVEYFKNKFPWDYFYSGKKDKKNILQDIERISALQSKEICYVGDGKYDVDALTYAGLGICPKDAVYRAKKAADIILQSCAGQACLWEVVQILESYDKCRNIFDSVICESNREKILEKQLLSSQEYVLNIMKIGRLAVDAYKSGRRIFLCEDRGYEGIAQCFVSEITSQIYKKCYIKSVLPFSCNIMILSIKNYYNTKEIYKQVIDEAAAKDLIIGISGFNLSEELCNILRFSKKSNMHSSMLMGKRLNGAQYGLADCIAEIPNAESNDTKDLYIISGYVLARYIADRLYKEEE